MRRLTPEEQVLSLAWKIEFHRQPCAIHADPLECEPPIQGCHLIPKQALRRRGLDPDIVYDTRNGIPACYRAHRRSDAGLERFPAHLIPDSAWEFANELGLDWMLTKLYGERPSHRGDDLCRFNWEAA